MADDELSAPLGQNMKKKRRRLALPIRIPHIIAGALSLFLLTGAIWAVAVDDPLGGEPVAVVAAGFDTRPVGTKLAEGGATQGPRAYDGAEAPGPKRIQVPAQSPVSGPIPIQSPAPATPTGKTVTIIDGSTGKRQEVPILGPGDVRAPLEQLQHPRRLVAHHAEVQPGNGGRSPVV